MTVNTTPKKVFNNFFFLLFFLPIYIGGVAQNLTSDNKLIFKTISFDEKIDFGSNDNQTSWGITSILNNTKVSLSGNQINDFVFDKPGQYQIQYSDNKDHSGDTCHEDKFPHTMIIEVSATKMTYDFSKINFSHDIQIGSTSDIIISVPISIVSKNNKVTKSNLEKLTIAGIGCELVATPLQKEIDLITGTQILKFSVSGIISKPTYLMFDFIDCNNQVQTYNLPQIIN